MHLKINDENYKSLPLTFLEPQCASTENTVSSFLGIPPEMF